MSNSTDLRRKAADHEEAAQRSWERSDTDGFLSQWAHGISADKARMQARIEDAGGVWEFLALFDLDGNWVPAREISTRYGTRWMVLNESGRATGQFLPYSPKRRNTLAKRGYVEGLVKRPARAEIMGGGTGLSGAASAYVGIEATDQPHNPPVEIVRPDRWAD